MPASKKRGFGFLAGCFSVFSILTALPLAAQQDDAPRAAYSQEFIEELIQDIEKNHIEMPSILGGIDLRRAPAEVKKIARVLRDTKVTLSLEGQSIDDSLKLLREISGLNFVISGKARRIIEEAGADKAPKITLNLRDLPLENVLNLMAMRLEDYRFTITYGAILLVHKEEYKPKKAMRFYNITDLVRPLPDFPAPTLALTSPDEKR